MAEISPRGAYIKHNLAQVAKKANPTARNLPHVPHG